MEYKVYCTKFLCFFLCLYSSISCNVEFVEQNYYRSIANMTIQRKGLIKTKIQEEDHIFGVRHNKNNKLDYEELFLAKQDDNGDIFDCVDIKLQPTFQDPLFKNHTVQMSPSSYPYFGHLSANDVTLQSEIATIGCPLGTIPIWRNCRKTVPLTFVEQITSKFVEGGNLNTIDYGATHVAAVAMQQRIFGTRASTSVYEPQVTVERNSSHSASLSALINGHSADSTEFMTAGWWVFPEFAGDHHVRFHTYWKANDREKSCLNLLCSGFVQISSDIALGSQLKPVSVYGGKQYKITVLIFKDSRTANWWLVLGDRVVGYWQKSVFNNMENGAGKVFWGGTVQSPSDEPSTPMGSEHFPSEGYGKSAFYQDITVNYNGEHLVVPKMSDCVLMNDRPECYKVSTLMQSKSGMGFYFGGPGGCKH